jgi:hypothetical protein
MLIRPGRRRSAGPPHAVVKAYADPKDHAACRDPGQPLSPEMGSDLPENCWRFAAGQPLLNVVDKEKWY